LPAACLWPWGLMLSRCTPAGGKHAAAGDVCDGCYVLLISSSGLLGWMCGTAASGKWLRGSYSAAHHKSRLPTQGGSTLAGQEAYVVLGTNFY